MVASGVVGTDSPGAVATAVGTVAAAVDLLPTKERCVFMNFQHLLAGRH